MMLTKFRHPLVRVGAGVSAMAMLAIGLWPTVEVVLDPEKAFAFIAALAIWLFIEIYPETSADESARISQAQNLTPHDFDLANTLTATVDGDFVRFLRSHDFGASWQKSSLDPAYELEYLLEDTNSVFEHPELSNTLNRVKESNLALVEKTAFYGGPIAGGELFDMIPTMEKQSGIRSERTEARIAETNKAADQLAEDLATLFSLLRKEGLSLAKKPAPERTA